MFYPVEKIMLKLQNYSTKLSNDIKELHPYFNDKKKKLNIIQFSQYAYKK